MTMHLWSTLDSAATPRSASNGKRIYAPCARPHAVGNEIEALQSEDVIQPDCPGITHGRLQHAAKWSELPIFETDRIKSGQAPVLSGGIEHVRRRTDRRPGQDGILVAPGVKTVAAHADRNIEIEPDRAGFARGLATRQRSSCSWATHCTNSTKPTSAGALCRSASRAPSSRSPPLSGHSHQGPTNFRRSTSKHAKRARDGPRCCRKRSNAARRSALAFARKSW